MRTLFKTVLFYVVLLVVQFSVFPRFWGGFFEPDLLLATVIVLGMLRNGESACIAGFVLGLLSDVNAGLIIGCNAFAWTQVGMASHVLSNHLVVDSPVVQTAVTGFGCILAGCFQIVFYRLSAVNEPFTRLILLILSRAIATALIAWPIAELMRRSGLIPTKRHA